MIAVDNNSINYTETCFVFIKFYHNTSMAKNLSTLIENLFSVEHYTNSGGVKMHYVVCTHTGKVERTWKGRTVTSALPI